MRPAMRWQITGSSLWQGKWLAFIRRRKVISVGEIIFKARGRTRVSTPDIRSTSLRFISLTDTLYKLVISAPILDDNGKFLGVICTALPTDARLGIVIPGDSRRKVALIGPEDKESEGQPQPGKAVIAFHPAYKAGLLTVSTISPIPPSTQWIHAEELNDSKLLLPARDDYADPVGSIQKEYQGRWIAGFASVGNTGFVVVVQQSYKEARAVDPSTIRNLTVWTAVVIFLAVITVALVLRRWFRRSNAPNHG